MKIAYVFAIFTSVTFAAEPMGFLAAVEHNYNARYNPAWRGVREVDPYAKLNANLDKFGNRIRSALERGQQQQQQMMMPSQGISLDRPAPETARPSSPELSEALRQIRRTLVHLKAKEPQHYQYVVKRVKESLGSPERVAQFPTFLQLLDQSAQKGVSMRKENELLGQAFLIDQKSDYNLPGLQAFLESYLENKNIVIPDSNIDLQQKLLASVEKPSTDQKGSNKKKESPKKSEKEKSKPAPVQKEEEEVVMVSLKPKKEKTKLDDNDQRAALLNIDDDDKHMMVDESHVSPPPKLE